MNYFVTGIGTNIGKTIVSAVLTEALQADYWKPVQSGTIDGLDSDTVKLMVSNPQTVIYPETYLLKQPLSPHLAAEMDGIEIQLDHINLPLRPNETNKDLIIEGAGGLLVPLTKTHYVVDMAKRLECEIVLVVSDYLGCINHTLLSVEYLVAHHFKIHSVVFNGDFDEVVKDSIIARMAHYKLLSVPKLRTLSKEQISQTAITLKAQL